MKADRWQQVDRLLDEALALPKGERDAFLAQACDGDEDLRREVVSLLGAHEKASDGFLNEPALEMAAKGLAAQQGNALIGKRFGFYQIHSLLGVGGMGEVYLARDERLGRQVALKLLPKQFVADAARVERFAREAKAASALNHPNIVTVHDIGEIEGAHFIAMEYVDGLTLREKAMASQGNKLSAREVVEIALQVSAALAAAHEAGIIHRDIKPENVMVRRDGYVKVLDFGLVKLTETERSGGRTNPSLGDPAKTNPGAVLGTAKYMSPEQALGREVDRRSDVFSLGVMLYELLAGVPPFKGDRVAAILDAVIHHQPIPLTQVVLGFPTELDRIISRTLEKDCELRFQSANDLRADLKRLQKSLDALHTGKLEPETTAAIPAGNSSTGKKLVWAALGMALLAVAGLVWWWFGLEKEELPNEATYDELTEFAGIKTHPTLSPNGQFIVYARKFNNQFDLFRQRVGGSKPMNLTESFSADDNDPCFSPDGSLIAFSSERDVSGVYLIEATGENERLVVKGGFNPSWSPDGSEIVYSTQRGSNVFQRVGIGSQIWSINWKTGTKRQISAGPDAVQPRWSPHGNRIAFWGLRNASQRDIWTIPASGGEPVAVTNDSAEDFCPVWSHDGRYLYFSSNRSGRLSLWRVRIDEITGKTLGNPQPLSVPSPYSQFLTISGDGKRMAYASRLVSTKIRRVPFDPVRGVVTGQPDWETQITRRATNQDVSPDGQWIAFFSFGDPQFDIFVSKIGDSDTRQLTNDRFHDRAPRWSPDGKRIAFFSDRTGKFEIWAINRDGGNPQQMTFSPKDHPGFLDPAWSPDGTRILFSLRGGGESFIMDLRRSFQDQTLFVLPPVNATGKFTASNWSPDNNRIAGMEWQNGNDLGGLVVYELATQRYERINREGDSPYWLPDNRRLVYVANHKIYLIDSQIKAPRLLLSPEGENTLETPTLSRDGRFMYFGVNKNEESIYLISLK